MTKLLDPRLLYVALKVIINNYYYLEKDLFGDDFGDRWCIVGINKRSSTVGEHDEKGLETSASTFLDYVRPRWSNLSR